MTEKERIDIHKEQTDDIYRSIGKFAVEFEQMVFEMGFAIKMILSLNGLKNNTLAEIVTADLTAQPIYSMYKSMILEMIKPEDEDKKIVTLIMNKTKTMIEIRNDMLHGTWFVGWGEEGATDFSVASGHKIKKSSNIIDVKSFEYTSENFDGLSKECEYLKKCVNQLFSIAISSGSVSKNFDISKEGDILIL